MQLKIDNYLDIIVEWIPYNQFDNIKEINKDDFSTIFSAIWKDGPLKYSDKKLKRWSSTYKQVALKCYSQNITDEFFNEV